MPDKVDSWLGGQTCITSLIPMLLNGPIKYDDTQNEAHTWQMHNVKLFFDVSKSTKFDVSTSQTLDLKWIKYDRLSSITNEHYHDTMLLEKSLTCIN